MGRFYQNMTSVKNTCVGGLILPWGQQKYLNPQRAGGFSFAGLFYSVLYRTHCLQVENVLLNGRNLERLVTGQLALEK